MLPCVTDTELSDQLKNQLAHQDPPLRFLTGEEVRPPSHKYCLLPGFLIANQDTGSLAVKPIRGNLARTKVRLSGQVSEH